MTADTIENMVEDKTTDEELTEEIELLRQKVGSKDKRVGTAQQQDISNTSFKILVSIWEKVQSIGDNMGKLASEIQELKTENNDLKKRVLSYEMEKADKAIIVKNFPRHFKKNERETPFNLAKDFTRVLQHMNVEDSAGIANIYRIKSKTENGYSGQGTDDPVRVEFYSKLEKGCFMSQLKKIRNSEFSGMKVGIDVPKILQPVFNQLNQKSWNFRQANPNSKTRIVPRNLSYALIVKKENEPKFHDYIE